MLAFFSRPSDSLVEHELTLVNYQTKKVEFDPRDVQHTQLVTDCAQSVKEKLKNLQTIDIKMTAGFALGTAALCLSYILPFSLVATAGLAYGAYQLGRRQHAYAQYINALENLSKSCVWTLGEVDSEQSSRVDIKNHPAIKEMIATLAPLTSSQQLRDFIDDRVEEEFVSEAQQIRDNFTLFDEHLDREKVDLYFKIYGYKQGGFLAILEGMGYAIVSGFIALKTAVTPLMPCHSPA
ncbi:hypothetical protein TUM19329_34110 [Legionella antarctica]|uniref:Uncharacterized protein n=1 Tax=Legionella antarctica TaxID=2708020 RepID=A0A6F8TA60_9GAMM|nr:hypothetical protein [Legionella antarctica]BCA97050.1 hypothetical protein TUM19329_34110 [Legionella antarctica]